MFTLFAQHIHPPSGWMRPRLNLIKQGHNCSLPPMHWGSHGPCVHWIPKAWILLFFVIQTSSVLLHVWPIFQTSCRQWATPPAAYLIFHHRSQHFIMDLVDWSHSSAHWLFVIVVRSSLVMRVNWKWINAEWSSDRGKEGPCVLFLFDRMSFSHWGPALVVTDPWLYNVAHISWFVRYNMEYIKLKLYNKTFVIMLDSLQRRYIAGE